MYYEKSKLKKLGSTAFVIVLGVITATVAGSHITKFDEPIVGVVFSVITTILGLSLVFGGYWLYARSDFNGDQHVKIALWSAIGTFITAVVLILMILYQLAEGAEVEDQIFFIGGTMTVGAAGGFLMGTYDARRVRAEAVVNEKEKVELFNQILRHNVLNATNILHGQAQLLQRHVEGEGQRHLDTVLEQSDTISELTQKVRTLIEETQRADAANKLVDVGDVLEEQVEKARKTHDDVTIHFENDSTESTVMADGMLSAVFDNLLDNAIRHNNSDEPEIRISVETTDDSVIAHIADDGPGMPDQVKEPLVEGESADLQETGVGLGLYLVSRFMNRYAGEIRIENRDPRGTTVDIELPSA